MFQGRFSPPSLGTTGTPIPLAGDGTIDITDAGLAVKGFRARGGGLALLTFVVGCTAGMGAAWLVARAMGTTLNAGGAGGVIGASLVAAAAIPRKSKNSKPWELVFPWESVRKVAFNKHAKSVVITIKHHKPKGQLHFVPSTDAQAVVNAIEVKRHT